MSELLEQEQAANALMRTLLAAEESLKDKFGRIYDGLGNSGFVPLLDPMVGGSSHPFYLEAVVMDATILRDMGKTLPEFLRSKDVARIVDALISHMRTLEGQEEAIRLHRDVAQKDTELLSELEPIFFELEKRISRWRDAWTQKFGINPNIHDVEAAVRAAAAGPKIEDLPPPGPDFC